jgi:hypothetical protein
MKRTHPTSEKRRLLRNFDIQWAFMPAVNSCAGRKGSNRYKGIFSMIQNCGANKIT